MAPPSPELVELARRIIQEEAGASPDPAAAAAALEAASQKLKDHLVDLLGSGGVNALLRRALHLAQREQPLLAGLAVNGAESACFTGLTESLAARSEAEATAAAVTILTHMLDLLVLLLGEELGTKPIRKLWSRTTGAREIEDDSGGRI
jgi:hypothetical protein